MSDRQEGLPATSLFLLVTALFLFGIGGGLVGYMIGHRDGEARADGIIGTLVIRWEGLHDEATGEFDRAIDNVGARLEKAAADLKAEVAMYHGCGAICSVIAYQFGEELLHTRDAVKKTEPPSLPAWADVLTQSGLPVETGSDPSASAPADVQLKSKFSRSSVLAAVALLSAAAAACFGMACVTILKLRAAGWETV